MEPSPTASTSAPPTPKANSGGGEKPPLRRPALPLFSAAPKHNKWIDWIDRLIAGKEKTGAIVNAVKLKELCHDATETLGAESTCLNLKVQEDEAMLLIGDIHGQFRDMYHHILTLQSDAKARGEKDMKLLFLGDYVDRGPQSVEVITLLLALKVEYPDNIFLLRGNHEDMNTCRLYGFMAECKMKLQLATWYTFTSVFSEIPLAATIEVVGKSGSSEPRGRLFCCHGGLSPALVPTLETLNFIVRQSYGQGNGDPNSEVVDGLLWSDPADHTGFHYNQRGCGHTFGRDVSDQFCFGNKFEFIVRAHQMAMKGYQWDHGGRLLTVFSSPNYCGVNDNLGAIVMLHGSWKHKQESSFKKHLPEVQFGADTDGGDVKSVLEFLAYDVAPAPTEASATANAGGEGAQPSQLPSGYFEAPSSSEEAKKKEEAGEAQ